MEDVATTAQMRKGVLEYCVLANLRHRDTYGLELAGRLMLQRVISGEGSIYPVLARLRRRGLVKTDWRTSATGPPRRYYSLTAAGADSLAIFTETWRNFRDSVDGALEETWPASESSSVPTP